MFYMQVFNFVFLSVALLSFSEKVQIYIVMPSAISNSVAVSIVLKISDKCERTVSSISVDAIGDGFFHENVKYGRETAMHKQL